MGRRGPARHGTGHQHRYDTGRGPELHTSRANQEHAAHVPASRRESGTCGACGARYRGSSGRAGWPPNIVNDCAGFTIIEVS